MGPAELLEGAADVIECEGYNTCALDGHCQVTAMAKALGYSDALSSRAWVDPAIETACRALHGRPCFSSPGLQGVWNPGFQYDRYGGDPKAVVRHMREVAARLQHDEAKAKAPVAA